MNAINFRANYISPVNIKEKRAKNFVHKEAAFVEFDKNSVSDINTLLEVSDNWKNSFAENIFNEFACADDTNLHAYGIVKHNVKQKDILPQSILGLVLVKNEPELKTSEIRYLQVDPENRFQSNLTGTNIRRNYKGVGTAILNVIKHLYMEEQIELFPAVSAIKFYIKNKFHFTDKYKSAMYWKKFA